MRTVGVQGLKKKSFSNPSERPRWLRCGGGGGGENRPGSGAGGGGSQQTSGHAALLILFVFLLPAQRVVFAHLRFVCPSTRMSVL